MDERPIDSGRILALTLAVLERLTAIKLRVGLVRLRLGRGRHDPRQTQEDLAQVEDDATIAAAATHEIRQQVGPVSSA